MLPLNYTYQRYFDTMTQTTLLISAHPDSRQAWQALHVAQDLLKQNALAGVFFYGDGAYIANALRWQSADVPDVAAAWATLADKYDIVLPVCVSTALARGVSDKANAYRHNLDGYNLKPPFVLVGLSELAMQLDNSQLIQI